MLVVWITEQLCFQCIVSINKWWPSPSNQLYSLRSTLQEKHTRWWKILENRIWCLERLISKRIWRNRLSQFSRWISQVAYSVPQLLLGIRKLQELLWITTRKLELCLEQSRISNMLEWGLFMRQLLASSLCFTIALKERHLFLFMEKRVYFDGSIVNKGDALMWNMISEEKQEL